MYIYTFEVYLIFIWNAYIFDSWMDAVLKSVEDLEANIALCILILTMVV